MTLAEIAATCPNWRAHIRPALLKARGISPHRAAMNRIYKRRQYQKHRQEILATLRRNRASGRWVVSRKGRSGKGASSGEDRPTRRTRP
jgi:hypothetical protein